MPPPSAAPKSAPRGNSFIGLQRSASTGTQDGGGPGPTPPTASQRGESGTNDLGGASLTHLPPSLAMSQQHGGGPPSPSYSQQSGSVANHRRGNDGGDDIRQVPSQTLGSPPLPSTHSPHNTMSQGPALVPSSSSEPRAPGSGVFVKRKVKKAPTSSGDTPQPSRRSPHRAGSEGSSTPRVRSILRNPMARHSTVTFSADVVGLTLDQLDAIPVLKKADVEQSTMRDEVFASLHGPVSSREQITVNITADDDGQGVRIEGIIDHLRNNDEQNAVIRRLADFLHSPNVFGKSLAPFLALGGTAGDRTLNEAVQRILVREARINDVPIKSVAPSTKSTSSQGGATPKSGKTGATVCTPSWDPDYSPASHHTHELGLEASQSVTRYERRRKAYQASLGIVYASPLAIPTPHQGRWDRPHPDPYVVRPDPVENNDPARQARSASLQGHYAASNRGLVDTPRSNLASSRGYAFVPHGVVDSPTTELPPSYYPPIPQSPLDGSPMSARQPFSTQLAQQQQGGRLLIRDAASYQPQSSGPNKPIGNVYRTRQYVTEDPPRSSMRR